MLGFPPWGGGGAGTGRGWAGVRGYHGRGGVSPTIDLPDGYETYKKQHREGGSGEIRKIEALERKMEREVGPLRFEAHAKDGAMLDWVAQRKGRRCAQKGY